MPRSETTVMLTTVAVTVGTHNLAFGVGAGVLATGVEYMDEPGLAVMLCNLPQDHFEIFHGRHPLVSQRPGAPAPSWRAFTAQVHADG